MLLKVKNEAVLAEVEKVLGNATRSGKQGNPSAYGFSGVLSEEDTELMETAIEEGCEQIHPEDWK